MFDEKTANPDEILARIDELELEIRQQMSERLALLNALTPLTTEQEVVSLSRRAEVLKTETAQLISEIERLMELHMRLF